MTKRIAAGAGAFFALALAAGAVRPAQEDRDEIMREKLALAQGVLAGLASDHLDAVALQAASLAALTRDARWRVRETPEYLSRSVEFERTATALAAAAGGDNRDGAALAWVQMNVQCLDCHRWARAAREPR